MAFTFPLSHADFMAYLPMSEIQFSPPPQVQIAQTAGGEVMAAELGPMLWRGMITLGRMTAAEARHADVLLDLLGPAGRSFWAYDTRYPAPALDPTGALLGAATPLIHTLSGSRELQLNGLPVGYKLSRGDYLSFAYGAGRTALHRVAAVQVTANVLGVTPAIEVSPMIRPGAVAGTAVTLIRASCKARIIPGQTNKGTSRSTITEGMTFQFIQTLKGP